MNGGRCQDILLFHCLIVSLLFPSLDKEGLGGFDDNEAMKP